MRFILIVLCIIGKLQLDFLTNFAINVEPNINEPSNISFSTDIFLEDI